jgi:hypothetical protein
MWPSLFHPASPGAEPSEPWIRPDRISSKAETRDDGSEEPALSLAGKRHPFSLRPNKQEVVVTVSMAGWQPESGEKDGRWQGK